MLTPEQLQEHKTLLARIGLDYTEVFGPTDMTAPKVVERMTEVAAKAFEVPSTFNLQNDFDLGNQVRMLTRRDSGHEAVVCAARDRIFQLSLEVARLKAALGSAAGELEEAADKFWVIHCNHPGGNRLQDEDKHFLAAMSKRSGGAARAARGVLADATTTKNKEPQR